MLRKFLSRKNCREELVHKVKMVVDGWQIKVIERKEPSKTHTPHPVAEHHPDANIQILIGRTRGG